VWPAALVSLLLAWDRDEEPETAAEAKTMVESHACDSAVQ